MWPKWPVICSYRRCLAQSDGTSLRLSHVSMYYLYISNVNMVRYIGKWMFLAARNVSSLIRTNMCSHLPVTRNKLRQNIILILNWKDSQRKELQHISIWLLAAVILFVEVLTPLRRQHARDIWQSKQICYQPKELSLKIQMQPYNLQCTHSTINHLLVFWGFISLWCSLNIQNFR